jgi:hypothetical protein
MILVRALLVLGMALIKTACIILGYIFIPIAVACRAYLIVGKTNHGGDRYDFTWDWLNNVWGNWEDGVAEGWQYKDTGSVPKQILWWSIIRNPANNLRTVPYLSFILDKAKVRSIEFDNGSYFAWHGLYSCIYLRLGRKELWVGWKLRPQYALPDTVIPGYLTRGVGFAMQFGNV